MAIELYKVTNSMMYTPFIDGRVHKELFYFLEYRYRQPEKIHINLKRITEGSGTLRIIAYRLKFFLDLLDENNKKLENVTYEYVKQSLDKCQVENEWENDYYNQTYTYLRHFFEFLPKIGVVTSVVFPAQRVQNIAANSDGDFLSHVRNSKTKAIVVDPNHKRTVFSDNFKGKVLSMEQFHTLYKVLKEIDPVYATIALVKMQTCLRIENLCQIPLNHSQLNPNWMQYPQFKRSRIDTLEFNFIGKGRKRHCIHFFPVTIERIYKDYTEKYFDDRLKLFHDKYMKRKNASMKEGICVLPDDILWLDKNGNPVKPSMVQAIFRKASELVGFRVWPHMMRHTGATHLLWNYCQILEIEPNEIIAGDFMDFLQYTLGHVSLKTTKVYIRTIIKKKAMLTVPFCLPAAGNDTLKHLPLGVREVAKIIDFFEVSNEYS